MNYGDNKWGIPFEPIGWLLPIVLIGLITGIMIPKLHNMISAGKANRSQHIAGQSTNSGGTNTYEASIQTPSGLVYEADLRTPSQLAEEIAASSPTNQENIDAQKRLEAIMHTPQTPPKMQSR